MLETINNPHDQSLRRYFYNSEVSGKSLLRALDRKGITADLFPRVLDVCAGDGSIGALLLSAGWQENRITCIDQYVSPSPLLPEAQWLYYRLEVPKLQKSIPEELSQLLSYFDLITCFNGSVSVSHDAEKKRVEEQWFVDFFTKPGGVAIFDWRWLQNSQNKI